MYLVVGGHDQTDGDYNDEYTNLNYLFSSTEILTEGSSGWIEGGPLPSGMWGLKGVSLNNRIIMTGNILTVFYTANTYTAQWGKYGGQGDISPIFFVSLFVQ